MITFIWLIIEPILPMIFSFNRMSYFRNMETNKTLLEAASIWANESLEDLSLYGTYSTRVAAFKAGATWQEGQPITEDQFKRYVLQELSACGYFMSDYEPEWLMKLNNPDWKPYSSKPFGEMLLDFACQYNMEHGGKDYEYKLRED